MELKLVETNKEQLIELENFLEKKENQNITEETFFELAKQINFSFSIEECSRLLSHHLCESLDSYTQQSQRYVKMNEGAFVIPQEIKELGKETEKEYIQLNNEIFEFYNRMTKIKEGFAGRKAQESDYVHGIKIEDGRYILPISTTTNVFQTMNFSNITRFYKTMNNIKINESRTLLTEADKAISKIMGKETEKCLVIRKIHEFADKGTADETKIMGQYQKNFDKISAKNNCILINSFNEPILRTGLGALTSTNEKTPSEILSTWEKENIQSEKAKGVTERVTGYGHTSIIEHARTTFGLMMTLTCYHQFERHRLPSNIRERLEIIPAEREVLLPESVKRNTLIEQEFNEKVEKIKRFRAKLKEKGEIGKNAQTYLLINADMVKIISSTNARMDKEIMSERLCNNAQWEIRHLYEKKLETLKNTTPLIYDKIGPGCIRGACPEGTLTCGKIIEMREKYNYNTK
ncbi:MAG: FAD-dependent thymidylate synthase [archaeon]